MKLFRAAMLGVSKKRTPTMAGFAEGWWDMKRGEYYLEVSGQHNLFHEHIDTKTHEMRYVTIPSIVAVQLVLLQDINGDGYLFSTDGGTTPISRSAIYRHFQRALEDVGIGREEQRRRNLTFHKRRHFFNSTLRMGNVANSKVSELTGHKSEAIAKLYTHFDPRELIEVRRIQEGIVASGAEEIAEARGEGGPFPA